MVYFAYTSLILSQLSPWKVCKCIFYLYALIKTQTKQVCTAVNSSKHNFYHHPWPTELIVHTSSLHFEYVHPVLTISSDLLQLHNVPLSKIRSLFRSTRHWADRTVDTRDSACCLYKNVPVSFYLPEHIWFFPGAQWNGRNSHWRWS